MRVDRCRPARSISWLMLPILLFASLNGCARKVLESSTNPSAWPEYGLLGLRHQTPSNSGRMWRPDLAIMPFAEFEGNEIVIRHVRNCT